MNKHRDRMLKTLDSLVRKQEWSIAELRSGLSQAQKLVEQLSLVVNDLDARIAEAEGMLRMPMGEAVCLAVDSMQRNRQFLMEQREQLDKVLHERQRAESLVQEFMKKLREQHQQMRVYENLSDRRRDVIAGEQKRAVLRQSDELWLSKVGTEAAKGLP